ncbi:hypothetical protein [Methylobacter sp.]|uniref:hypothetical protein n=1 Tax=Methylobacter sp. TaxID=2051955 RepID=UPI003DA55392
MKLTKTIIASVLVLGMGSAFADEPVALTETQMDNVTAAGLAVADAGAIAAGLLTAATATKTTTGVIVLNTYATQGGQITKDFAFSISKSAGAAL